MLSWSLSDEQMSALSTVEPQVRMLHGEFWCKAGPYKTVADLWDE